MSSNVCKSYGMGKKQKFFVILSLLCIFLFNVPESLFSQCQPYIKINGDKVLANQTIAAGLSLPFWLSENQTLAVDQMVNSISVIEFNVTGSTLEFSNILLITSTTPQAVPAGKVWKVESISKKPALSEVYGAAYSDAGTYTFVVPPCASYICIEVWGGGGGGGGGYQSASIRSGGGGGGGGYGQECFNVTPGSNYTVTVGAGGAGGAGGTSATAGSAGGTSSVGILISAIGGNGGGAATSGSNGTGGTGGTSTASVYVAGGKGQNGSGSYGGNGGSSGSGPARNGGAGGAGGINDAVGSKGSVPGGGGGGGGYYSNAGGSGACGGVIITW